MSEHYGQADQTEAMETLQLALDLGINFLDTADLYGCGANERLVGEAIRTRRDGLVVATKFGNLFGTHGERLGICGKPDYVRRACEASLRRLNIEVIDLYYQHRVDPATPIEETVGAMSDLVREGKVRFLGLSEASSNTTRRAHAVHPIAALQAEYSLWTRDPEPDVVPTLRALGIGFVPYSPLGRGFLTGRFRSLDDFPLDDSRRSRPRFVGENFRRNWHLVERLEEIARGKNCTAAQVALAWVLAQGDDVVPIPGTKRRRYLRENLRALELRLTEDDLVRIEEAFPLGAAVGPRYSAEGMRTVEI
jgi:aryl-alcohol dehydrogenase-like predicted oxidoreductase